MFQPFGTDGTILERNKQTLIGLTQLGQPAVR